MNTSSHANLIQVGLYKSALVDGGGVEGLARDRSDRTRRRVPNDAMIDSQMNKHRCQNYSSKLRP